MITQRELLFFNINNKKSQRFCKTYYLLAGMVAEMEQNDPRRGLAKKLMSDYAQKETHA